MYDQLKLRLASLLRRPRPLKPQTERQISGHLAEHASSLPTFLMCARDVLEEYELDIVFGPLFTPTLDDRAELADLLCNGSPTAEQLQQLVVELCVEVSCAMVRLPDGTDTKLALHEVMVERFIRLLRLECGPTPSVAAALREALPAPLQPIGMALLCERGMTPQHQKWLVAFVQHAASRRKPTRAMLETTVSFIAGLNDLDHPAVCAAAEALSRATQGTAAYAASGHAYWSPDVAQHHQYRGEGKIDQQRVSQRMAEAETVTALLDVLRTFEYSCDD